MRKFSCASFAFKNPLLNRSYPSGLGVWDRMLLCKMSKTKRNKKAKGGEGPCLIDLRGLEGLDEIEMRELQHLFKRTLQLASLTHRRTPRLLRGSDVEQDATDRYLSRNHSFELLLPLNSAVIHLHMH